MKQKQTAMPSIIKVLDDQTVNQIAAGEVIENPASVVKELVENSLDAGATQITIEISAGGRQLIRVIDNGCGMNHEDALLSLEQHATSKIEKSEDIQTISTMGFRGEAIPSIAAISKMTIMTAHQGSNSHAAEGTLLVVEGGSLLHQSTCACSPGTTIEVQSLFYNVPARRKFQKSIAADTAEVLKFTGQLALANPQVSFKLICNQKLLLSTNAHYLDTFIEQLQMRSSDVLGKDFVESSLLLNYQEGDIQLRGLIGTPSAHRNNRSGQYLFINQRAVFCPLVSYSISEGYGTLLPPRRFPVYVLHLTLPGSLVDINVHPQKKEVRLRSSNILRSAISRGVEQALQGNTEALPAINTLFSPFLACEEMHEYTPSGNASFPQNNIPRLEFPKTAMNSNRLPPEEPAYFMEAPKPPLQSEAYFSFTFKPRIVGLWSHFILLDGASIPKGLNIPPALNLEGLLIVDQHAAHARVLFDGFLNRHQEIASQELLVPIHMHFSHAESLFLNEYLEDLNQIGIGIRPFGDCSFIIEALPASIPVSDVQTLMMEIIGDLDLFSKEAHMKKHRNIQAALASSKAAVKRKTFLSMNEAEELIQRLFHCDMPFQCPQGKATIAAISAEELQKKFRLMV